VTTTTLHPLAADYLDRLRRSGRGLGRSRLRELIGDIEAHLSEAIAPGASDIEALTVIDRLGEPEEIVAAELPQTGAAGRRGTREWAAIFLLLFGGFLLGFGWIAGVVLLWSSAAWTTRDKWIGTLVIPGGLACAVFVVGAGASTQSCSGQPGGPLRCTPGPDTVTTTLQIALLALAVGGPCVTAIYLARRAA
jgi:hypothetical protein